MEEPILNLVGEQVALGPLRRDLVPLQQKWLNDFEVTRTMALWRPVTAETVASWLEPERVDDHQRRFLIYERASLRPIGTTSLRPVDQIHRNAEFNIMIGEKECWGRGYGTEAARLMLDYGFNALGLHNIMLRVAAYNERGIRAYTRAGFREFGRRREGFWFGGRAWDLLYMECLATEFESPVLRPMMDERTAG